MTTEPAVIPSPTVPGTCSECLYWQPLEVHGYCHFNAPTTAETGVEGRVIWPRTLSTDWCGQWTQAVAGTVRALPGEM